MRLSAEADAARRGAGQAAQQSHQPPVLGGFKGGHRRVQGRYGGGRASRGSDRRHAGAQALEHRIGVHARQQAQVNLQFGVAADAVGIVAGPQAAQVQRGHFDFKKRAAVPTAEFLAKADQLRHHRVHGVQRVVAQGRIGRVPGGALKLDGDQHEALVGVYGLKPGGFADDGGLRPGLAGLQEKPAPGHGGLLIAGGRQDQRRPQLAAGEGGGGAQRHRKEALHVAGAQAVEAAVALGHGEGILTPGGFIEGHGVGVPGQHQPAFAGPQGGDQIGLAGDAGQGHQLDGGAQALKPAGQVLDDPQVALIDIGVGAAHRWLGDQRPQHFPKRWQRHRDPPKTSGRNFPLFRAALHDDQGFP